MVATWARAELAGRKKGLCRQCSTFSSLRIALPGPSGACALLCCSRDYMCL